VSDDDLVSPIEGNSPVEPGSEECFFSNGESKTKQYGHAFSLLSHPEEQESSLTSLFLSHFVSGEDYASKISAFYAPTTFSESAIAFKDKAKYAEFLLAHIGRYRHGTIRGHIDALGHSPTDPAFAAWAKNLEAVHITRHVALIIQSMPPRPWKQVEKATLKSIQELPQESQEAEFTSESLESEGEDKVEENEEANASYESSESVATSESIEKEEAPEEELKPKKRRGRPPKAAVVEALAQEDEAVLAPEEKKRGKLPEAAGSVKGDEEVKEIASEEEREISLPETSQESVSEEAIQEMPVEEGFTEEEREIMEALSPENMEKVRENLLQRFQSGDLTEEERLILAELQEQLPQGDFSGKAKNPDILVTKKVRKTKASPPPENQE
jgi:hypothetical protein